jgi:hypothetical protein
MYGVEYGVGDRMKGEGTLTEIATYMWPGFLAEWCEGELTVWELCSPSKWLLRKDITAPPATCIATTSSQVRVLRQQGSYLVLWERPEPVWRVLRLQEQEPQQMQVQSGREPKSAPQSTTQMAF